MEPQEIQEAFGRIGARVSVQPTPFPDYTRQMDAARVAVSRDGEGEFFDVRLHPMLPAELAVVEVDEAGRRLVLEARSAVDEPRRFVCASGDGGWSVELEPQPFLTGVIA